MNRKNTLGERGEQAAADYLIQKGCAIVERNYHSRYGEIDIIAVFQDSYIFVEVKTRGGQAVAEGRESVGKNKQRKLRNTALIYLSALPGDPPARFDVIEVVIDKGEVSIEHIVNAF